MHWTSVFPRARPPKTQQHGGENRDSCDICDDGGDLICCDHCGRSYHGVCLELQGNQLPATWVCPKCELSRRNSHLPFDLQTCQLATHEGSLSCYEVALETPQALRALGATSEQNKGDANSINFVRIGVIPRAPSRNASFEMDLGHEEVKPNLKMPSAETQVSGRTLPSGSQKPAAGQRTEGEPTTSHAPNASLKVPSRQQTPERSISHALSEDGGPILEGELLEKPNGWKVLQDHPFWLGDVEQVSIDTGTQTLNEDHTCKARAIVQ